jgi:predicted nucleic acid-binding protein
MKVETSRGILTDAGFWIALFDKGDNYHSQAITINENIKQAQILFPWPIFYEVLRTRFIRNHIWIDEFSKIIRSLKIYRFDDTPYRENALEQTLEWARTGHRQISLVDMVVRYILSDTKIRITNFITFNDKDFLDICKRRKIPINL